MSLAGNFNGGAASGNGGTLGSSDPDGGLASGSAGDSQGGSNGIAGSAGALSGNGGSSAGMGTGGHAGTAGNNATGSGATGSSEGSAGTGVGGSLAGFAGGAGSSSLGPCGDIDQNGVDDCSETLVTNSRFQTDLGGWTAEVLDTLAWDTRNAEADSNSGALRVSNLAPVAGTPGAFMTGAHQCVAVSPGATYVGAVRALIPGGQNGGEAGINLQIFDADECGGTFLEAQTLGTTADVDAWRVVQGELRMPPAARSMWLRLVVSKPFAVQQLEALFDDVLLRAK